MQLDASAEEAQLHSAEADLELASADWEAFTDLVARKVISKAEIDAAESKFKQKSGAVDQMRSMITKKTVRAPFDGQLGIRQVNVGQSLIAGQEVVPLTSLDSLFADFALPQQRLPQLSAGLRSARNDGRNCQAMFSPESLRRLIRWSMSLRAT